MSNVLLSGRVAAARLAAALTTVLIALSVTAAAVPAQGTDWIAPERRARRPNPVPATADVLARAQALYRQECASCHGANGRGDGSKAAELETKPGDLTSERVQAQTDGALFWKITEGRGDMPNNRTTLTDEERWMLVNYLRTLVASRS